MNRAHQDEKLNKWLQYGEGEDFLSGLRHTSRAREFCRSLIMGAIDDGFAKSIVEFGVGGLNERIAMDAMLKARPEVEYTGADWSPGFIAHGRKLFPNDVWAVYDVTAPNPPTADIGYSQHVLEHCSGLCPALSHMLEGSRVMFVNIFFLTLDSVDRLDFSQYPIYHNTYSPSHIAAVCEHMGFTHEIISFDNGEGSDPRFEAVLVARKIAGTA